MKIFVLLVLLGVGLASRTVQIYSTEKAEIYFEEFIKTYKKHYADEAEKQKRFEIFKQNLEEINQKNLGNDTAHFGINFFTDLTQQEFIDRHTGYKGNMIQDDSSCQSGSPNSTSGPDSWDWRDKGVISQPKNQETCGSCWAFSAIGNVEAHYAITHNDMVSLSEQQLVDCDQNSQGCGGTHDTGYPFMYLVQNGAMQEQDYPYQDVQGTCQYDASKVKAQVSSCISYSLQSEDDLKNVVSSSGPVSITVDANSMKKYTDGILQDCAFDALNHVVLLVGYGTENGQPFWVIKNSWGTEFGENGFIRIKRGLNACGLMNSPAYEAVVS